MDDPALDELPRAYRIGLRLRALGADRDLIADCLEIDPDGIVTLLEIGAQKLERARETARVAGDGRVTNRRTIRDRTDRTTHVKGPTSEISTEY